MRGAAHAFNANNQDTASTYDGNGAALGNQGHVFRYDAESRLTSVGSAGGGRSILQQSMTYTGDGLRATRSAGLAMPTCYLYDGDEPVCEMNSWDGSVGAVNTSGANGLLSRRSGGQSVFYTFDPSGSVAQRLNGAGGVVSSDAYDAFGARQGTGYADAFGYGGQWGYQTDAGTGLVLCTHRYYDPSNGRWLTRDPMGYGGGINQYGYCQNNPVNAADPLGLWSSGGSVTDAPNPLQEIIDEFGNTGGNIVKIGGGLALGPVAVWVGIGGTFLYGTPAGPADEWGGRRPGQPIGYTWGPQSYQGDGPGSYDNAEHTTTKNGKKHNKHTKVDAGGPEKKDKNMDYPPPKKAGGPAVCPPKKAKDPMEDKGPKKKT